MKKMTRAQPLMVEAGTRRDELRERFPIRDGLSDELNDRGGESKSSRLAFCRLTDEKGPRLAVGALLNALGGFSLAALALALVRIEMPLAQADDLGGHLH